VFTTARHLSQSSARSTQSTISLPINFNAFFLILPSHYVWVFQAISFLPMFLLKLCRNFFLRCFTCPAHLIPLDCNTIQI
jgi:hypothetical protein